MSVGTWEIAPSEFWRMTPAEWWLIFDVKRPDKDQVTPDYDAMLDHLEKAQQQHEQLRIAEHGIDW